MKTSREWLKSFAPKTDVISAYIGMSIWGILFFAVAIGFIGDLFRIQILLTIAQIMAMTFFVIVFVLIAIGLVCGTGYLIISVTIRHNDEKD